MIQWNEPKQGPTRHTPRAHPVVFRYLSYSTTLAEHAVHRLRPGHVCSCLFNEMISQSDPEWWRDDYGPTNDGAMVNNYNFP